VEGVERTFDSDLSDGSALLGAATLNRRYKTPGTYIIA
jgi:hypothetical protein